jgi:hypothetical protein
VSAVPPEVLLLAENSNAYTPLGPRDERIETDGWVLWLWGGSTHPGGTVAQRFRLEPDEVAPTVAEIRRLVAERGRPASTWEVGSSATPADLGERLLALGMVPDDEHEVAAMVLTGPPAGEASAGVEARPVETLDEFVAAQAVAWEAFKLPEEHRRAERESLADRFLEQRDSDRGATFAAWLEGELVAMATATFTEHGVVLNAGSTLPHARGHGAYRALVRARWDEAVRRGTPALITQAGAMSKPILERLGFREVAQIRIYLDDPSQRSAGLEGAPAHDGS